MYASHIEAMYIVNKLAPEKFEKKLLQKYQTEEKMIEFIAENYGEKQKHQIENSIKFILKKHKYSRLFLIVMGKTFFIGYILFKTFIKLCVLYYIYQKT
jgi:hypothetical protein